MTKVAAIDLAPFGIRVNTVHPGQTRTPLTRGYREDPLSVPVRRQAEPEEISAMVVFLASDAASFCTGADFAVDGGTTAGLRGTASPARGGAE
jgi:3alpha(or 20beta)-hydroxysteroid dehydrogenase